MNLRSYPKPTNDTGIGFHYFPDTRHYSRENLNRWLPELRAMGASWLVLQATIDSPVPEFFLRELVGGEVEPVIHLSLGPIRALEGRALREPFRYYASCGAHYLFFFSEPNVPQSWYPADWAKPGLLDRFVDLLCPLLDEAMGAGLVPLLPPLVQGGYYWDTAFLAGEIEAIAARDKKSLFDRLAVCFENVACNRPLTWGRGGEKRWPDFRPYQAVAAGEDNCGHGSFDWYDEIVRSRVGSSLPLVAVKSGALLGDRSDERFSAVDEAMHAERSEAIARSFMAGETPDCVFNNAFWLLAAGGNDNFESLAWFKAEGRTVLAVQSLRDLSKRPREWRAEREETKKIRGHQKPLHHYVLFGTTERGIAAEAWRNAIHYVRRFRPTCGFSADEAMNAEYVTVLGGAGEVSPQIERAVRAAGCKVERISGDNWREIKRTLDEMATEGKRFRTF